MRSCGDDAEAACFVRARVPRYSFDKMVSRGWEVRGGYDKDAPVACSGFHGAAEAPVADSRESEVLNLRNGARVFFSKILLTFQYQYIYRLYICHMQIMHEHFWNSTRYFQMYQISLTMQII